MADVTYEIIVRQEGGSSGGSATPSNVRGNSGGIAQSGRSSDAGTFSLTNKQKKAVALAAITIPANRIATTFHNRVGVRTGNVTYQERINYAYSTAKKAVMIGSVIVGGAMTGNVLAVAAGIGSAVSWGVDIAVAQDQLNLQRSVENIGISQANIRAGAGGDRSGKATY